MIQNRKLSQRQLLIARAKRFQLTSRLKNNLQEIQQKTEKLSRSRCSSISSKSQKTQRSYLSVDVRQKSSKVRLLQNIVEKLKHPKQDLDKTSEISTMQEHLLREDNHLVSKSNAVNTKEEIKVEKIGQSSPPRHKSKLQTMLKDIKRCNQQSTKAVNSVKKGPLKTKQDILQLPQLTSKNQPTSVKKSINQAFKEITDLKQELRKAKQQNKLLVQIVQINQYSNQPGRNTTKKCEVCGCTCKGKPISKLPPRQLYQKRSIT